MAENPVTAARRAIHNAGRPLHPREAVLIAAAANAATAHPGDRRHDVTPTVGDVITDLRTAVVDSAIANDPAPAIQAIRRLLSTIGVDTGDPAWTPTAALTPHRDPDARELAAGA